MSMEATVAGSVTRTLLATAARRGLDPDRLLEEVGLDRGRVDTLDARLPVRTHIELFARATRACPDLAFDVGQSFRPGTLHGVGQAAMNAPTLGAAWACLERYWRLVAEGSRFALDVEGGVARVRFFPTDPSLPFPREGAESVTVGQVTFARWLTHQHLGPRRVTLPFAPPEHADRLARFFGCPVDFEADAAAVAWDEATLRLPVVEAHPELEALFERRLRASLERMESGRDVEVVIRAREAIARALRDGEVTVDRVARSLRSSRRSLQRRLSEAGTSFQQLVDGTRRASALELVEEGNLPAEEVAYLVGYADVRTFYRAFRRWTGTTPAAWRSARAEDVADR